MKKLAALLLAATMCVSVTACGSSTKEDTSAADNTTAEDTAEEESASDSALLTKYSISVSASWYSTRHWMPQPKVLRMPL